MNMRQAILDLVEKNDGKWTWYQLERGITARGWGGKINFMELVTELINEGLIFEQQNVQYPHPLYQITEDGKAFLNQNR